MELKEVNLTYPEGVTLILAQAQFIKTVEDVYEALIQVPNLKFGFAFAEASGKRLIRSDGNDDMLKKLAQKNLLEVNSGHVLLILFRNAFPIQVLPFLKQVTEIVNIYCATGNPVQVIVAETSNGRGVLGVIDGYSALGLESSPEVDERKALLRKLGYKK
ncbi:Adenosine specific kinase [uncultured archaeon]|nr:Adenosine specific kinase [uncultured archaeon]